METQNKNQNLKESHMYFVEKAQWKKDQISHEVMIKNDEGIMETVGFIKFDGYNDEEKPKPLFTGYDLYEQEIYPQSTNLFGLKREYMKHELAFAKALLEKDNTLELSEEESRTAEPEIEEEILNVEEKEKEVNNIRQQKDGKGKSGKTR